MQQRNTVSAEAVAAWCHTCPYSDINQVW